MGCYKRINKIHERSIRLILCINVLLTEVYKYLNGYSSDLMNEVFYLCPNYYNYAILMPLTLIICVTNTY